MLSNKVPAPPPLSLTRTWETAQLLLRTERAVLIPVAGLFFFLSGIMFSLVLPADMRTPGTTLTPEMVRGAIWPFLLSMVALVLGHMVITAHLLSPARPTVAEAIVLGARCLPAALALLAALLVGISILGALPLLLIWIVPLIYLIGRLAVFAPALVAGRSANPLDAARTSFAMTRGNGWRVAGVLLMLNLGLLFGLMVIAMAAGTILLLLGKLLGLAGVAQMLVLIVANAFQAGLLLFNVLVQTALWRQLAAD